MKMRIEQTVKQISNKLDSHGLYYEVTGDRYTFSISPTCAIHTYHCTTGINKNKITFNEKPVENIDDMIDEVSEVESGITPSYCS